MIEDFAIERRRIVHCLVCGTHDAAAHLPLGYAQLCGHCGRTMQACNADRYGCGSGVAKDEAPVRAFPTKEETWRDRPPLL